VQILGELVVPGTIAAVLVPGVRLVRIILGYRLRRMEIELLREQLRIVPGSQPAKAAGAGRSRRPRRLR
jgi:hypothetical protein